MSSLLVIKQKGRSEYLIPIIVPISLAFIIAIKLDVYIRENKTLFTYGALSITRVIPACICFDNFHDNLWDYLLRIFK